MGRNPCVTSSMPRVHSMKVFECRRIYFLIVKHLQETHRENRVPKSELLAQTTGVNLCDENRILISLEEIYIKAEKLKLNSQTEGSDRILKTFLH